MTIPHGRIVLAAALLALGASPAFSQEKITLAARRQPAQRSRHPRTGGKAVHGARHQGDQRTGHLPALSRRAARQGQGHGAADLRRRRRPRLYRSVLFVGQISADGGRRASRHLRDRMSGIARLLQDLAQWRHPGEQGIRAERPAAAGDDRAARLSDPARQQPRHQDRQGSGGPEDPHHRRGDGPDDALHQRRAGPHGRARDL